MLLLEISLSDRNDIGRPLHRPMDSQPNRERSLGEGPRRAAKHQTHYGYRDESFSHVIPHLR